ncbi:MAG: N-acetylmuramoyl-L-alanine amidase, partial [Clostridia bacterium]|nr:N-acetylmuramoyl-L-alanine amidase [Clostridia bacterium]
LQTDNTRVIKPCTDDVFLIYNAKKRRRCRVLSPCTDDVFLIYNAKVTAVLIECGFLSNRDDLVNLKNEEYQMKLAFAISSGLNNYINGS